MKRVVYLVIGHFRLAVSNLLTINDPLMVAVTVTDH